MFSVQCFRKHKISSCVALFFRKPNWSSAKFSSILFSVRPKMIFVNILDVCVMMLKVLYCSHFVDWHLFVNITVIRFLKSLGIFSCCIYTGCFKKSFTTLKAYRNLYRGHTQRFELSKCSKTHRVLPRIVIRNCYTIPFMHVVL